MCGSLRRTTWNSDRKTELTASPAQLVYNWLES